MVDVERYIEVPTVYEQVRLTVENAAAVAEWLHARRISQEPPAVDEEGVFWQHVMTGRQRALFGQYIVVMRDGFAVVYADSLSSTMNHQQVEVGAQGRVALKTDPV